MSGRAATAVGLAGIVLLAAALRLSRLGESPPGLNVDEAANAWNAYCLLETGKDQHGVSWPIFDSKGFGQGTTTLSLYLLIPFQAAFGLNVPAARMPAALGGVITVLLLFWVGARLFGSRAGLLAALLLALDPWHLQQTRWGHMGSLFPLLALAPLALMLWARLPLGSPGRGEETWRNDLGFRGRSDAPHDAADDGAGPSPPRALVAGLVSGLCAYGYFAARLFVPVFIAGLVLVSWRQWARAIRARRSALAILAFGAGFAALFLPLALKQLTDPQIAKRAAITWVWGESDPFLVRIGKVLARYPGHFGPGFLFAHGDPDPAYSPPEGFGLFFWSSLPLMAIGLAALIAAVLGRRGRSGIGDRPAETMDTTSMRGSRPPIDAKREPRAASPEEKRRHSEPVAAEGAAWRPPAAASRLLLAWLVFYPAADLLNEHPGPHALRSLPGAAALCLLAAVGGIAAWRWSIGRAAPHERRSDLPPPRRTAHADRSIGGGAGPHDGPEESLSTTAGSREAIGSPERHRAWRAATVALALFWAAALAAESAIFLPRFFGPFNRELQKFHVNHVDLLEACAWLRPRLAQADAVYCTSAGMSHPYIYTLVALGYDPAQWFADPKSSFEGPLPNGAYNHETIVTRYGKMRFMIARSRQEAIAELNEILMSGRRERLVLIVRPGELAGLERRVKPALEIRNPKGEVSLQVFEIET